jgi:hypothetical protein
MILPDWLLKAFTDAHAVGMPRVVLIVGIAWMLTFPALVPYVVWDAYMCLSGKERA